MQEYGSFNNLIASQSTIGQPEPTIGGGTTSLSWSDKHANTVVRISKSGKTFWHKRDIAKRIDNNGMSECQTYEYSEDPDAQEVQVRLRKNGQWKEVESGRVVQIGFRRAYHDFSF